MALRKQTSTTDKIIFPIKNLIDKSNKKEDIYFKISNKLSEFNNDIFQFEPRIRRDSWEKQQILDNNNNNSSNNSNENQNKNNMTDGSAKSPDFSQDNKLSVKKSDRKDTITHIKSRNFLSNIFYVGINKEDFYNENFIFDIYLLMTKNLNPFSLDRKMNDQNKHEMIYI